MPTHESNLTKELMWRKSDIYECFTDLDEQAKEIKRLNAENTRLKQESTERADKIRSLVHGIDGAQYWAPLDAVAHLAREVKRLRAENAELRAASDHHRC